MEITTKSRNNLSNYKLYISFSHLKFDYFDTYLIIPDLEIPSLF
jgi:hypothetical protein